MNSSLREAEVARFLCRTPLADCTVPGRDTEVFRTRMHALLPCSVYVRTADDTQQLEQWKTAIDKKIRMWSRIADRMKAQPGRTLKRTREQQFRAAFGDPPAYSHKELILFAISDFLLLRQPRLNEFCYGVRNALRHILGGTWQVTDIGRTRGNGIDSCLDLAVCVGELARMYGIEGEVIGAAGEHVFWHERSPDPLGGVCIEPAMFHAKETRGFLRVLRDQASVKAKLAWDPSNTSIRSGIR